MANAIAAYAQNRWNNHLIGASTWTLPSDGSRVWIALCTTTPGATDTGATIVEPSTSGTAYARLATTASVWDLTIPGQVQNGTALTFATATGAGWGTITGFAIVDNATAGAGNMIGYGAFGSSKAVAAGVTPQIAVAALVWSFDSGSDISNYLRQAALAHMLGQAQYTAPTIYVALTTAAPVVTTAGSALAEPSGSGYARKATSSSDWVDSSGTITNSDEIDMAAATGSWVSGNPLTDVVLCDASSNGNVLLWGVPSTSKTFGNLDRPYFVASDLSFTIN